MESRVQDGASLKAYAAAHGGSAERTGIGYELCLSEGLHAEGAVHPHVIAQGLYEDERDVGTPLTIVTACSCGQQVASTTPPIKPPEMEWEAWEDAQVLAGRKEGYVAFRAHVEQLHPASLIYWPPAEAFQWDGSDGDV